MHKRLQLKYNSLQYLKHCKQIASLLLVYVLIANGICVLRRLDSIIDTIYTWCIVLYSERTSKTNDALSQIQLRDMCSYCNYLFECTAKPFRTYDGASTLAKIGSCSWTRNCVWCPIINGKRPRPYAIIAPRIFLDNLRADKFATSWLCDVHNFIQ